MTATDTAARGHRPMTATLTRPESSLLHKLRAKRIAAPDPLAWLATADLLEEQGEAGQAHRWRRRGEWFDRLMIAVLRVAGGEAKGRTVFVGAFAVSLTRKAKTVLFEVLHQPAGRATAWVRKGATKGNLWRLHTGRDVDGEVLLWRERVLDLIDELSALEAREQ